MNSDYLMSFQGLPLINHVPSDQLAEHIAGLIQAGEHTVVKLMENDGELRLDHREGATIGKNTPPEYIGYALHLVDIVRFLSQKYTGNDATNGVQYSDDEIMGKDEFMQYVRWYLGLSTSWHEASKTYYKNFLDRLRSLTLAGDYYFTPIWNATILVRKKVSNVFGLNG